MKHESHFSDPLHEYGIETRAAKMEDDRRNGNVGLFFLRV
jgi:hypothetical protein